jgi:hypothetical protein
MEIMQSCSDQTAEAGTQEDVGVNTPPIAPDPTDIIVASSFAKNTPSNVRISP